MLLGLKIQYKLQSRCICGAIECQWQGLCHCGCGEKAPVTNSTRRKKGKYLQISGLPVQFLPNHRAKAGLRDPSAHRTKGSLNKSTLLKIEQFKLVASGTCNCGCGGETEVATRTEKTNKGEQWSIAGLPKLYVRGHEPCYQQGEASPFFKGRIVTTHGYIKIYRPAHERADDNGYVYEHLVVMEDHLGRSLYKEFPGFNRAEDEVIHHKDGDKQNNAVDNLQVMTHAQHMKLHRGFPPA